jgi:hypothetical protein
MFLSSFQANLKALGVVCPCPRKLPSLIIYCSLAEPPLTDENTDFWAGMRMNDNALDEEKAGFDIISIIPNLCKPGTGVQRNLDAWAKGALKPIHVLFRFIKFL